MTGWPHPQKPIAAFEPRLDERPYEGPIEKVYRPKKAPKGIPKENPSRKARQEERNFGAHGSWVRKQPCVIFQAHPTRRTKCRGRIMAAHLKCRQMGGCGGDRFSLFPACEGHHDEQEGKTAKFQARYDIDLAVLVEQYNILDRVNLTPEEREAAEIRLAKLKEPR